MDKELFDVYAVVAVIDSYVPATFLVLESFELAGNFQNVVPVPVIPGRSTVLFPKTSDFRGRISRIVCVDYIHIDTDTPKVQIQRQTVLHSRITELVISGSIELRSVYSVALD